MSRFRPRFRRPSAPLIIALTALVAALAVPAYGDRVARIAAKFTKADGRRIVKVLPANGLTGKKIRESTLGRVPRATQADAASRAGRALQADNAATADLATKAGDADKLDGKDSTAFVTSNLLRRVRVTMSFGEDVALIANGPVSLRAQCDDTSGPNAFVRVYARTTEANAFVLGGPAPLSGGSTPDKFLQPATTIAESVLWSAEQPVGDTSPHVVQGQGGGSVAAASGPVIAADGEQVLLGLNAFGSGDCTVLARVALDTVA
jgi:hypothetical protein